MEHDKDKRWVQRFNNFSRAFALLRGELGEKEIDSFDQLQQEGLIQRFEYTFDLLWKTLRDYLEYEGVKIELISPKNVFKTAAETNLLESMDIDGEVLLEMLYSRNQLSHTYDFDRFKAILVLIKSKYLIQIDKIYIYLLQKRGLYE